MYQIKADLLDIIYAKRHGLKSLIDDALFNKGPTEYAYSIKVRLKLLYLIKVRLNMLIRLKTDEQCFIQ